MKFKWKSEICRQLRACPKSEQSDIVDFIYFVVRGKRANLRYIFDPSIYVMNRICAATGLLFTEIGMLKLWKQEGKSFADIAMLIEEYIPDERYSFYTPQKARSPGPL